MKRGAYDFLAKPFMPEELRITIRRGLERRKLVLETESLNKEKKLMDENFITIVSHQLRSPLVAILQYFEVILGGMAGQIIIASKENKDFIATEVQDTGLGIAKEHIPFIFDRFYRVKRDEDRKIKGHCERPKRGAQYFPFL
jgi:signal transduction histidine kinase